VKIFYEILDKEVYIDIFISEDDLSNLQDGRLISKDTLIPVYGDEFFEKKVSIGIISPQAKEFHDGIWDEEIDDIYDSERE
jgi:hypothetical protein